MKNVMIFKNSNGCGQQQPLDDHLSLIVQIKIKNKGSKTIKITNIFDYIIIDQQIRWFMQTNNLKEAAFDYIKSIITKKIQVQREIREKNIRNTNKKRNSQDRKIFINLEKEQKNSIKKIDSFSVQDFKFESPNKMNLNTLNSNTKNNTQNNGIQGAFMKDPFEQASSFVFNSSFTLPSSIGQKDRSFLTDQIFENGFDTIGKNSQDFSSINEVNQIQEIKINSQHPPLSVRNHQEFKIQGDAFRKSTNQFDQIKLFTPRKPIKITLTKKNRQNIPQSQNQNSSRRKKIISTKARKDALMTPKRLQNSQIIKFQDLNCSNTPQLNKYAQKLLKKHFSMIQKDCKQQDFHLSYIPQYLSEDLQRLFKKLTLNNPIGIQQLHSQYVSYQKLGREQLLFMGALFEKIDHKDLNNLNFESFKRNAVKYCWKELEEMHNLRFKNETLKKTFNDSIEFRIN